MQSLPLRAVRYVTVRSEDSDRPRTHFDDGVNE
jgi:hypothetical protein